MITVQDILSRNNVITAKNGKRRTKKLNSGKTKPKTERSSQCRTMTRLDIPSSVSYGYEVTMDKLALKPKTTIKIGGYYAK